MVVPFCLASIYMARKFIPIANLAADADKAVKATLDWMGLALATIATLSLLNALVTLQSGSWSTPPCCWGCRWRLCWLL